MKKFLNNYGVYLFFAFCFAVCLFRAFKGFCWTDESFYYSTCDRFYRGDALLKEEWYRTQMSSVFCLPFYAVYMMIAGTNAGVILYFRILYLILSFSIAYVVYVVMKKEYPTSVALIMATLIMFYAHLNITTFSYYMLSVDFLLLALTLIYDYKNTNSRMELVIAGVVFALSVMAMPALVVGFIAVIMVILLILIARRFVKLPENVNKIIDSMELFRVSAYIILGICIPALIFVVYMFTKVSIEDVIKALPGIMVDNEHDFTYGYLIRKFFRAIKEIYGKWTDVAYFMIAATFVLQKFLNKKKQIANVIVLFDVVLFIVLGIKSYGHTGYIQAAYMFFALPIFFLTSKKNHRLFWLFGTWGMILAVTYCFTSSDFLYVLAIGFFIVAIASVAFVYDYISEQISSDEPYEEPDNGENRGVIIKLVSTLLVLASVYFACVTVGLRLSNVYRDAPISELNCKITKGPGKGLYTTSEHLEYYNNVCDCIDEYASGEGRVMFSKVLPWGYLYSNMRCGYPTTWRASAYNADQLEAFYELNADNYPDVIFVLDEKYGSYDAAGDVEDDHNPNLDEMNDYWKKYIRDNNMHVEYVKCGKVYIK